MHVPAAKAFIEAGIHVICDKPLSLNLKEALALEKLLAKNKNVIFALTHNYSGYPMIRQARAMVAAGELGDIRLVQGEYPQDWLTDGSGKIRPEAGGLAHRSGNGRVRAAALAISARTPISSAVSSRASSSMNFPPTSRHS